MIYHNLYLQHQHITPWQQEKLKLTKWWVMIGNLLLTFQFEIYQILCSFNFVWCDFIDIFWHIMAVLKRSWWRRKKEIYLYSIYWIILDTIQCLLELCVYFRIYNYPKGKRSVVTQVTYTESVKGFGIYGMYLISCKTNHNTAKHHRYHHIH